ncbi:MAG TPA: flavocytochrome C, partial [Sutterella wadsworthensis]|nr:flavocytochrome C [Sutterella wadsworthensis]
FEARSGLHPRSWAMPGNSAGRSYVLAVMDCYRRLGGKTILSAKVETLERQESF